MLTLSRCRDTSAAAKDAKRAVRSGERDIDREVRNLDRNEKSLVAEIKKTAKGGNQVKKRGKEGELETTVGCVLSLLFDGFVEGVYSTPGKRL